MTSLLIIGITSIKCKLYKNVHAVTTGNFLVLKGGTRLSIHIYPEVGIFASRQADICLNPVFIGVLNLEVHRGRTHLGEYRIKLNNIPVE